MEKQSQTNLYNLLIKNEFDKNNIFLTPNKNKILKEIFKHGSKKNTNHLGIPDLIYFEENVIIIFECKSNDLYKAEKDLRLYKKKIHNDWFCQYTFFYVSFVDETLYKIMDHGEMELDIQLYKKNFGLKQENKKIGVSEILKKIHNIHDYIRSYTKISDEEKPFFIAIILISVEKECFQIQFHQKKDKRFIYDLLVENLKDFDMNISVFEFMRNHNSNIHLYNLIVKIIEIKKWCDETEEGLDILNLFYNEFVKYYNTDSKSLGIVLTPDYICELMVRLLDIKKNDVVLDLCAGTGSFLWKTLKYHPKKIIGCEYQTKLFSLLKCNNIIRNKKNIETSFFLDDCFQHTFECTKSIINPPFSQKEKSELDFVLKQLQSVQEGGLVISILPLSKITCKSQEKDDIIKISCVRAIIILNDKVFYPCATVQCVILLLEKSSKGHSGQVKIIDLTKDGYDVKRGSGKEKNEYFQDIYDSFWSDYHHPQSCLFSISHDNWLQLFYKKKTSIVLNPLDLRLRLLEQELVMKKKIIIQKEKYKENKDISSKIFHSIPIDDLFHIYKNPIQEFDGQDEYIFEISARKYDNGVNAIVSAQQVNKKDVFQGKKIVLITGGEGGAGLAYYQEEPFIIRSCTIVLEPKSFILNAKIGHYLALELSKYKQIYGRGYGWTLDRIRHDTINMPVNEDNAFDFDWIESLYS